MKFKSEIRKFRNVHKMTQQDFANLVGVSFVSVNRWESGRAKPHPIIEKDILSKMEEYNAEREKK